LVNFEKFEIISNIFSDHNAMRLEIDYKKKTKNKKQQQQKKQQKTQTPGN